MFGSKVVEMGRERGGGLGLHNVYMYVHVRVHVDNVRAVQERDVFQST